MKNTYKIHKDDRLPLLVVLIVSGCDNFIRNYNPKHHIAQYLQKLEHFFKLIEMAKKEWSTVAMVNETEREYILDAVHEAEGKLIEFRNNRFTQEDREAFDQTNLFGHRG